MKAAVKLLSAVGLVLTVLPAALVFAGKLSWTAHELLMLIGTVVWFAAAPFWMDADTRRQRTDD